MSPRKYGEGKTPIRSIRIEPELWDRFKDAAKARGTDVSSVLREYVQRYVDEYEQSAGTTVIDEQSA